MRVASRDRTLPCYARICLWALPECAVHVRVSKRHACRLTALCSLLHRLAGCERSSGERVPRSSASIVHASDYMYIGPAEMRKSRDSDVKVSWCGDRGCIVGIHRCNSHAKRAYKCHSHDPSAEPIHTSGPRSSRRPPTTRVTTRLSQRLLCTRVTTNRKGPAARHRVQDHPYRSTTPCLITLRSARRSGACALALSPAHIARRGINRP